MGAFSYSKRETHPQSAEPQWRDDSRLNNMKSNLHIADTWRVWIITYNAPFDP